MDMAREPAPNEELHKHPGNGQPELHVFGTDEDGWNVWLNTGIADFDGLVIGSGDTRQAAITDAVGVAEWIEATLQGPPALQAMSLSLAFGDKMSVRLYNALMNNGLDTVAKVSILTEGELIRLRGMGRKSLMELQDLYKAHGLGMAAARDRRGHTLTS